MAKKPDLSDYVEVNQRIVAFYDKFPEGSLRCRDIRLEIIPDIGTFLIYVAEAWRHPEDPAPAQGSAWEPVPGKTQFTKDSELMNAETSAWGRAIAALGFEVNRGIASANEIRSREGTDAPAGNGGAHKPVSTPQMEFFERLLKEKGESFEVRSLLAAYASAVLTGGQSGTMSLAIEGVKDEPEDYIPRLLAAAEKWSDEHTDMPADTSDLPAAEDLQPTAEMQTLELDQVSKPDDAG